jgi:hypothetical protein
MRLLFIALLLAFAAGNAAAKTPACSGPDNWAAGSAYTYLKNENLISSESNDFTKTKVALLASEKISKDLYRQIHLITFADKTGHKIEVITSNEASSQECSMSDVQVFVISQKLGG